MIKITAPSKVDGVQMYGPHAIEFVQGVAEVEDLAAGVELYMRGAGYTLEYLPLPPETVPEPDLEMLRELAAEVEPTPEHVPDVTPEPNVMPAMVGESGPELVELPKPGRVTRARKPKAD